MVNEERIAFVFKCRLYETRPDYYLIGYSLMNGDKPITGYSSDAEGLAVHALATEMVHGVLLTFETKLPKDFSLDGIFIEPLDPKKDKEILTDLVAALNNRRDNSKPV